MGMGKFNSDNHYIYYCGQESLRRKGVSLVINKRIWNAVLGCNLKNDRAISNHFQGKPFNITVIQVYAPITDAKEAEVPVLWRPRRSSRINTKKDERCPFHHWDQKAKVGSQQIPRTTVKFGLGVQNEAGQRLTVLLREHSGHSNPPFPTQRMSLHMDITRQ